MRIVPWLFFLVPAMLTAAPTLELYDTLPRTAQRELVLVLKISNPDDVDYFVLSESITDIPYFVSFRQDGKQWNVPSHDCATGAKPQRLRAKSSALIDVRVLHDVMVSTPVTIRSQVFTDAKCTVPIWTNEVKVAPTDFFEKGAMNCPTSKNEKAQGRVARERVIR